MTRLVRYNALLLRMGGTFPFWATDWSTAPCQAMNSGTKHAFKAVSQRRGTYNSPLRPSLET